MIQERQACYLVFRVRCLVQCFIELEEERGLEHVVV